VLPLLCTRCPLILYLPVMPPLSVLVFPPAPGCLCFLLPLAACVPPALAACVSSCPWLLVFPPAPGCLCFLLPLAACVSSCPWLLVFSSCPWAACVSSCPWLCSVAWLIGWALIYEYTVGGAAVARGISPKPWQWPWEAQTASLCSSPDPIPGTPIVLDPCAALAVGLVSILLGTGIEESALVQSIVTLANVAILTIVVVVGLFIGFAAGWPGYAAMPTSGGYFPFGVSGTLAASAVVFYSYIGFDAVCTAAEEVKRPQVDLPLGIGLSLSLCAGLYTGGRGGASGACSVLTRSMRTPLCLMRLGDLTCPGPSTWSQLARSSPSAPLSSAAFCPRSTFPLPPLPRPFHGHLCEVCVEGIDIMPPSYRLSLCRLVAHSSLGSA